MVPVIIDLLLNLVSVGPMAVAHLVDAITTGNLKIHMLCMYICVLQHIYAVHSLMHTHTQTGTHRHTHRCKQTDRQTDRHTHTHTHIHKHTIYYSDSHTYMHTLEIGVNILGE